MEIIKHKQEYDVPLRSMAFILYNTAKCAIYDPELYENYEKQMPYCVDMQLLRNNIDMI